MKKQQILNFDQFMNEAKQTSISESKMENSVIIQMLGSMIGSFRKMVRDYLKENGIKSTNVDKDKLKIDKDSLEKTNITLQDIEKRFYSSRGSVKILDTDSISDQKNESKNEASKLSLDEIVKKIGDNSSVRHVVHFCWDNYTAVTGLPESDRDEDMEFPDEILDIIKHYDFKYDRFADVYGQVAGA